jgi:hypothetical protein
VVDALPATVTDAGGNTYTIDEQGNMTEGGGGDTNIDNKINKIDDGDTQLYMIVHKIEEDSDVTTELIQELKEGTSTVFYADGESVSLPDGKYVFIPYQKYVKFEAKIDGKEEEVIKENREIQYITTKNGAYVLDGADQHYNLYDMEGKQDSVGFFKEGQLPWKIADLVKGKIYQIRFDRPSRNRAKDISKEKIDADKYLTGVYEKDKFDYVSERLLPTSGTTGVQSSIIINVQDKDAEAVWFEAGYNYNGSYGFDEYKDIYRTVSNKYKPLVLKKQNGQTIDYHIPNLSMWAKKEVTVLALIQGKAGDEVYYTFETSDPDIEIKSATTGIFTNNFEHREVLKENKKYLPITIVNKNTASSYNTPAALYVKDKNGGIVGQLNIYSVDMGNGKGQTILKNYRVIDVTLGTSPNPPISVDPSKYQHDLLTFLNEKAYNQAFIQFSTGVQFSSMQLNSLGNVQIDGNGDIIDNDPNEKELYDLLKNAVSPAPGSDDYIVFVINNRDFVKGSNNERTYGFANNGNHYVVLLKSGNEEWETVAHELGHCLKLDHPFKPQYNIPKGYTNNYMDYAVKTNMFWQWQWDILRTQ